MKIQRPPRQKSQGYVLLVTLGLTTLAALLLAGALDWSSQNASLTDRNNEYFTTLYAAEAATEIALTKVSRDYKNYGEGVVFSKITNYSAEVPTTSHSVYWNNYEFSNGAGTPGRLFINRVNPTEVVTLGPPLNGMQSLGATYQIIANAKNTHTRNKIRGAVGQEIHLGTIPIFQFAIFYETDLEINPGPEMNIHGFVHSNSKIYSKPGDKLTFYDSVTSSDAIYEKRKPGDPTSPGSGTNYFKDYHLSGVSALKLPVGTNTTGDVGNVSDNVHAILELPPAGESPNSTVGTNRLYNKADLILLVSNNVVFAKSGVGVDNSATAIPANQWSKFLKTNESFYNKRENNTKVQGVVLDVGAFRLWSASNTLVRPLLDNRDVSSIYIADMRATSNAVTVTNYTIITNYTLVTNTTPTTSLTAPASGTYLGTIDNTTISTNKTPPRPASPPAMNIVTNTTYVNDATSSPAAGTYVGSVTTNGKTGSAKRYQYNKIASYSYKLPAFAYKRITGISTNLAKTTNYFYSTNFNVYAQAGIVVENAEKLPSQGLTVVTPDPLYVRGNFNIKDDSGTSSGSDTSHARPAALMADAVTILSTAWNPANSAKALGTYRVAADTTVNAAILSGIVPTGNNYYSGGVENFPRFLEKWSGKTFTYNGSMVCMFESVTATAPWEYGGDIYEAPNRNWQFDENFRDPRKLPPLTPQVLTITRGRWSLITPGTQSF